MDYRHLAYELMECMNLASSEVGIEKSSAYRGECGLLLYLYGADGGITSGELSEKMAVSTGRIAAILNGLEKKNMIERIPDDADKRKVYAYITDEGARFVEMKKEELAEKIENTLSRLGEKDASELVRIAKQIGYLA